VVVSVAEFIYILAQVTSTDLVKLSDHSPLQDRPETFDAVCMDVPTNVGFLVINRLMVHEVFQRAITGEFVCHDP
jgi:hypothetical protein